MLIIRCIVSFFGSLASYLTLNFFLLVYHRTKRGAYELDMYLSRKHDELLANTLAHGSYKKTISLIIVDGFAVEITEDQVTFMQHVVCLMSICPKHSLLIFALVCFSLLKTGKCA